MGSTARRKTVTVLFSDLVGSTSLAERTDPEALAEQLSTHFAEMRGIIERHGGVVEKFIGDAIVGMFGVPNAHEDDALRAVRAALEMQGAMAGTDLAARIGINTGEVAVTSASGAVDGNPGQVALGHAINMAARLEQAADAGTVLIGAPTFELVASEVEAQQLAPITVKGSSEPLGAWRVTALAPHGSRGWEGEGLFVGRARELAQIEAAFETADREHVCVVLTVVAPPGMGKSRLAAEATRRLEDRALVLVGRCVPYGEGTTYKPLIEIATSGELPEHADSVVRARQALSTSGLASPEESAWAFKQMLESQAEQRPVVVVLDDLHWAEPLLLDLLDYVATFSVGRPIVLMCLARPDLFDLRPEWATPRANSVTLRLEPLSSDETESLLDADEATAHDPELRRRIVTAAGGVPLFIQQMGALRSQGEGAVPPTVRALLAARIDRLQPLERAVLERAAIQGEVFDRATIGLLNADGEGVPLASTLVALVRREFIRPERSPEGGERFRFSHALLRDAVYEQVPRRIRVQLHQRYAAVLAAAGADLEVIGHQLERAHAEASAVAPNEPATAQLSLDAGRALRDAGRLALARKEWQHGHALLLRARHLLERAPGEEIEVLPDLLRAAGELGDLDEAADFYRVAVARATEATDVSTELRAEIEWLQAAMRRRGNPELRERAADIAGRAVAHFRSIGDDSNVALALMLRITEPGLSIGAIIDILHEAQEHAERAADERMQIEIWDELGGSMIFGPTPYPEIGEFMRREAEWARERGIAFAEADGLFGQVYVMQAAGQTEQLRVAYAKVRDLFAQLPGFVSQMGECEIFGASIELEEGNAPAAEAKYRRAMEVLDSGGHVPWWTTAAVGLAHVLEQLERVDEAEAVLDEVERRGVFWSSRARTQFLQARAKLAAARGDLDDGLVIARQAVAVISDTDTPQYAARAHEVLGDLLARAGDADGSRHEYMRARDLYAAKGYLPGKARMTQQLAIG